MTHYYPPSVEGEPASFAAFPHPQRGQQQQHWTGSLPRLDHLYNRLPINGGEEMPSMMMSGAEHLLSSYLPDVPSTSCQQQQMQSRRCGYSSLPRNYERSWGDQQQQQRQRHYYGAGRPFLPFLLCRLRLFERESGLSREQIFFLLLVILMIYLVTGLRFFCIVIGIMWPIYATEGARRTNDQLALDKWVRYWTVLALVNQMDLCLFERLIPFYMIIKTAILLYIAIPQTNGALIIYGYVMAFFIGS
uniref:Receptor expression-enhancing protein n=1 Tax=Globodera rostochiensis TaxID=31243 RepID=A0A914I3K3_GLORO